MKQWYTSMERPNPAGWDGTGFPRAERSLTARLRGLLALAVCLCMTLTLLPAPAQAAGTPEGSWTDEKNYDTSWYDKAPEALTYTISTAEELAGLAKLGQDRWDDIFTGKTISLTADVDLSAHYWPGIRQFGGKFDGGGHTISYVSQKLSSNGGFFSYVGYNNVTVISNLRLYAPTISVQIREETPRIGALIGECNGKVEINGCVVDQPRITLDYESGTGFPAYVGGLSGGGMNSSASSLKASNCAVVGLKVTATSSSHPDQIHCVGLGMGSYENCFVSVGEVDIPETGKFAHLGFTNKGPINYLEPTNPSSCYWADSGRAETEAATGPDCYKVTAEQIAGTGTDIIGSNYANTPSLVTALNNWVAAQNDGAYTSWGLYRGAPMLSTYLPDYLDISGPLDEVTHQSATGDIDVGMDLEGQVQENVTLLSVTMPASIPFIVDVEANGAFKRVLSATGTLANRSDCPVNITLTAVTDDGSLLDKVDLFLIPDPAPSGDKPQIALAKGEGKTDLLAALDAPTGGVPTTATLKVDGADKLNGASIGTDGEAFVVGLTLKVSQQ